MMLELIAGMFGVYDLEKELGNLGGNYESNDQGYYSVQEGGYNVGKVDGGEQSSEPRLH
jgi:DNA/RNA endonuclease YhcR with UshA esterase domain